MLRTGLLFAGFLTACGGGGGGDPPANQSPIAEQPAPQVQPDPQQQQSQPNQLQIDLANILIGSDPWWQPNFIPVGFGSRIDAIYRFTANFLGTRQTILTGGSNTSGIGGDAPTARFQWGIDPNGILILEFQAGQFAAGAGFLPEHTEFVELAYFPQTDDMQIFHHDRGQAVWHGCRSTSRPGGTLAIVVGLTGCAN